MADPFGLDQQGQGDEQIRDYLGRLAPLAFRNQPALPVTGAPAVGAATGPVQPGSLPAKVVSEPGGPQIGSIAPSLISAALSGGLKLSDLAQRLFSESPSLEATPGSGLGVGVLAPQYVGGGLPELGAFAEPGAGAGYGVLRPEFMGGTLGFGEPGAAQALGGIDWSSLGSLVGPALSFAPSVVNAIEALLAGQPTGVITPALQAAILGAAYAGAIPTAASAAGSAAGLTGAYASALGPVGPLTSAASIIGSIIAQEITDPPGRAAVRDFNYIMSQQVPEELGQLQLTAAMLPFISDNLTNEQATTLYEAARLGLNSSAQLADPLGRQGLEKHGVEYGQYPGAQEAVQGLTPQAWLTTIRLQDLLARRGITPPTVESASPIEQELFQIGEIPTGGESGISAPSGATGPQPERMSQFLRPLGALTPAEALGSIGHYGGFEGQNLAGDWSQAVQAYGTTNLPEPMGGYLYGPELMTQLQGMQPGQYEQGLRAILSQLPGYAESPLAGLWSEAPGASTGTPAAVVAAGFGPAAMSTGGGGELGLEELET